MRSGMRWGTSDKTNVLKEKKVDEKGLCRQCIYGASNVSNSHSDTVTAIAIAFFIISIFSRVPLQMRLGLWIDYCW